MSDLRSVQHPTLNTHHVPSVNTQEVTFGQNSTLDTVCLSSSTPLPLPLEFPPHSCRLTTEFFLLTLAFVFFISDLNPHPDFCKSAFSKRKKSSFHWNSDINLQT